MGKSKIIPFVIKTRLGKFIAPFNVKQDGKPTTENLSKWRDGFNNSLRPGGTNEHLGLNHWLQTDLIIVDQRSGYPEVVALFEAPKFEVIN